MQYLVDTNVVSELMRPRPDARVAAWLASQARFALSAISVDESVFGLVRKERNTLLAGYERFVAERCLVLPITDDIARRAGTLRGQFARRGIARSQPDMLIAATAQAHNLTLVTRNTRDFESCGIGLLNPFEHP
ncbi:type II toxin-antitoxin system VapC family toxin [Pseudothauera nasutitermitis]|uniref:Ribonuclease VapC n=1 Tax=Pseudothauera nasutitermitis TaxID=2565930 RepID=A0A4S4B380_9RHOO|nr:type II toxin-antitoxin system VapC family toxin [Pseudothauera nasutitermitis]